DRELTAVRLQEWAYLRSEFGGELYDLSESERENRSGEGLFVEEVLTKITEQWVNSEKERLAVQDYSEKILD
ncbi:MAG: hypothetical protein ABEI86_07175, partial [Halobacteriaceae archaeon]